MILVCWVYVVCFGWFIDWLIGCENWNYKYVFLVKICYGLPELEGLFEKCIDFNKGLLMVLLVLSCCDDGLI